MIKEKLSMRNPAIKYIIASIIALVVTVTPFHSVTALMKGSLIITPSTDTWTNKNVVLNVSGSGVSKITLPDGTTVQGSSVSYTVTKNGAYNFIGLNSNNEVEALSSHVVTKIDRVKKKGNVTPNDGKWKNKDVEVEVTVPK